MLYDTSASLMLMGHLVIILLQGVLTFFPEGIPRLSQTLVRQEPYLVRGQRGEFDYSRSFFQSLSSSVVG
ncbi:hypothetical protein NBRC116597_25700 [Phaeobacter sp. NW0010-22]